MNYQQPQNFCGIATAKTGAHITGWFNFSFNAIYIALQVKKLAQIKNLADVAFHRRQHHWNTYDYTKDCLLTRETKNEQQECIKLMERQLDEMKSEIRYVEDEIVPAFYWSTLVPFFVLILSVFWLTQLESKSGRLVRAVCWTFVTAVVIQLFIQLTFLIYIHVALKKHIDCKENLNTASAFEVSQKNFDKNKLNCSNMRGIPWQLWFIFIFYAVCNSYFIPLILNYTRERIQWLNGREDDLISHASGIFFEDTTTNTNGKNQNSNFGSNGADHSGDGQNSITSDAALDRMTRGDIKNRKSSFRIEDDPFGDNFRASLEDIRTGTRMTTPKTPNMSRYSSRNSHDAIKEQPDLEAVSASSFSNTDKH